MGLSSISFPKVRSEVKAVSRLKSLSKIRKAQMSTERQTAVVIRQMEIDIMMPD